MVQKHAEGLVLGQGICSVGYWDAQIFLWAHVDSLGADRCRASLSLEFFSTQTAALSISPVPLLFPQKLRDAGVELPEAGKKGAGPQEENKSLKEEVKALKEDLDSTKKGEEGIGCFALKPGDLRSWTGSTNHLDSM